MYWYVSIYSEKCFWPQYMYPNLSPNDGFRWCPLGKLSHLGLEQLRGGNERYINGWNRWGRRWLEEVVIIRVTGPSYWAVPVQCWNTTTLWFGRTARTGFQANNNNKNICPMRWGSGANRERDTNMKGCWWGVVWRRKENKNPEKR